MHGAEHPDVVLGLNNVATVNGGLGEFDRAETLHLRSLAIRETLLGRDHADVGTTLKNLAELYRGTGRTDEGQRLFES